MSQTLLSEKGTSERPTLLLAGLLGGAGVLHLVRPGLFRGMVPRPLPYKHELVIASGVVEMASGALLVHPRTRRAGGALAVALLAGVWPANVQMTLDAARSGNRLFALGTLARLPLQVPLLRVAARAARSGGGGSA